MKTLNTIISKINIGGNFVRDVKVAPHVGTLKNVKQIFVMLGNRDFNEDFNNDFSQSSTHIVRILDNATYKFDVGSPLRFGVMGGTIDASGQITSNLTHGDGVIDNKGYSGNPVVSVPINYDEYQHSGLVSFVQNESGLAESLSWMQDADYVVLYGAIVIDSFTYSDALVDGTSAHPQLSYHQQLTYASGRTEIIRSGATILYSGQYVGNDGEVTASAITTEKARTKLTTANVSISNGGKSTSASCDVYQEANSVVSINAYASETNIPKSGATIQIYAFGTLKSGSVIDISARAIWSKSSGATSVSFSTSGINAYAEFGENFLKTTENIILSVSDSVRANDFNNDFDMSFNAPSVDTLLFTQEAGSSLGTLFIGYQTSLTTMYLNYTGASILTDYAVGRVLQGQVRFTGNALEDWGGLNQYSWRNDMGLYSSQDPSSFIDSFRLTYDQVQNILNGTDVTISLNI